LANIKSAIKRIRSSEKRRVRNQGTRTEARSYIKKARAEIDAGNLEQAKTAVALAVSALDKAAEKGIIHRNNASRRKSRLMHRLSQAMAQTPS
jgi:small subunit ribosomal protein S20